jgi:hypothetical protein
LLLAAVGAAQELPITPGVEPGVYVIGLGNGETLELSVVVEGPAREDHELSECSLDAGFFLVVTKQRGEEEESRVQVPVVGRRVHGLRAVKNGNGVVLAITSGGDCSNWRHESGVVEYVAVEVSHEMRVLLSTAKWSEGRCDLMPTRAPWHEIRPRWEVQGNYLWMVLGVKSGLCYSEAGENRGSIQWQAGELPKAVRLEFPEELQELAREAQALGFQPYTHFPFAENHVAMIAEAPLNMGSTRLLTVVDRRGRNGMLYLPRFGYQYEPKWRGEPVDRSDEYLEERERYRSREKDQWPQLDAVKAFEYSEDFLKNRPAPSVGTLLRNRRVSIVEVSMPCVAKIEPVRSGVDNERWLVRTERSEDELKLEAALIEPCSLARVGLRGFRYLIPGGEIELSSRSVRLSFPPPQFEIQQLVMEKGTLAEWARGLNDDHSVAAVEMYLNHTTVTIPRCVPAFPTTGRGWLGVEVDGCRINIQFGRWGFPRDQTAPVFVDSPTLPNWCVGTDMKPETRYFHATVRWDGRIEGLGASLPSDILPDELVTDVHGWRLEPARDADGNPVPEVMGVEVTRGIPSHEKPAVCQ